MRAVKAKYSKYTRWRLKRLSAVSGLFYQRPQVIFIHIPKTAGTTIRSHLRACLGSDKSGRAVPLADVPFEETPTEANFESAHKAQLVHGHMDWSSIDRLNCSGAYKFTFLRTPLSRLKSLYGFLATFPDWAKAKAVEQLLAECGGMSVMELARSRNPFVLAHADNYMVRQLAGSVHDYPIDPAHWPLLLEKAKRNLESLNFVGFQESFDHDFSKVLKDLNLPRVGKYITVNSTLDKGRSPIEVDPALYEWDQKLYDSFVQKK